MKAFGIAVILGLGLLTACSSDEEQGEEKLENDMNENGADAENSEGEKSGEGGDDAEDVENAEGSSDDAEGSSNDAEDSGGESEESSGDDSAATDDATAVSDPTDAPPADAMAEAAPPPEAQAAPEAPAAAMADAAPTGDAAAPAAAPAGGAPAATPPPSMWDPNRLVRFVKADGTPIYGTAQATGPQVGTLRKGDHVMVLMQGEWAMVSESAFIQGSALSSKAEPRTKGNNGWNPPSE